MLPVRKFAPLLSKFKLTHTPMGDVDALRLTYDNLQSIRGIKNIKVFNYDRPQVTTGILHFGLRDFHRVHQLPYIDQVLHLPDHSSWGVTTVGLNDTHKKAWTELNVQDGLFSLVSRSPNVEDNDSVTIIGSMVNCLFAPTESKKVIDLIASDNVKLITLTLKEANYFFEEDFQNLNLRDKHIANDLYSSTPRTPVGLLVKGLSERMKANITDPLTILSCDNLYRNGDITKKMVKQFIDNKKPTISGLSDYIDNHVFFPNSMCDRICNTDPAIDYEALQQIGLCDKTLLTTESFSQWVIEDFDHFRKPEHFPTGLRDLEGVKFVDGSSAPCENIKTRFNYGLRLSLACLATAIPDKFFTFEEIMSDPVFRAYAEQYCLEITDHLGEVPSYFNGPDETKVLIERISTQNLRYHIKRVVEDISKKSKMEWEPVIFDLCQKRQSSRMLALAFANWAYIIAQNTNGKTIRLIDSNISLLEPAATRALEGGDPQFFFHVVFGGRADDLAPEFKTDVISAMKSLQMRGTYETLKTWV